MCGTVGAGSAAGIFGVRRKPARSMAGRLLWEIRLSGCVTAIAGRNGTPPAAVKACGACRTNLVLSSNKGGGRQKVLAQLNKPWPIVLALFGTYAKLIRKESRTERRARGELYTVTCRRPGCTSTVSRSIFLDKISPSFFAPRPRPACRLRIALTVITAPFFQKADRARAVSSRICASGGGFVRSRGGWLPCSAPELLPG